MARLKDRQRQIPNGFKFVLPEVQYESAPFSSFDTIVNSVTKVVNANPSLAEQFGWPIDRPHVADWVDSFNAQICERNGWTEFYNEGGVDHHSPHLEFIQWPLWAKTIATLRTPADIGVGDTVERTIGKGNSDAVKSWYMKTFKRVCGCDGRKEEWNMRFRYAKISADNQRETAGS